MDRCVVLVDAGHLLGAAASLLAGEPSRSRITVDHAALIQGLRERAEADTEQPLLRIYWFDGAPDRVPQPEHRRLRVMPRVTVRLGALTRSDGRWAQKGVDAAMHAELTELARNRACSDVVLVTGDGDLLPGLMSAKEHGVAVHLWAVQAADGDYNQSEDLVAEADERRVLDRAWITRAVRAKDLTGLCSPPPAPRPDIAAILSAPLPEAALAEAARNGAAAAGDDDREGAAVPAPAAPGGKTVPTPKDLAGALRAPGPQSGPQTGSGSAPGPASALRWSSDKGWIDRAGPLGEPAETASLPTLAQLTSAEQRWADREEDITTVGGDPFEVGQVFARRWMERPRDRAPAEAGHHVPAHPAPHRRRAAAVRRPLRAARAQGRPDRRTRPVRHPCRVLEGDRRPRGRRARGRRTGRRARIRSRRPRCAADPGGRVGAGTP